MKKKIKILVFISLIVIIAGIVMMATKGFTYNLQYGKSTEIKLYVAKEVDLAEIKNIVKDVFKDKENMIQKVDYFNDSVAITVKDPTDEEINSFVEKTNKVYGLNNTKDSMTIIKNGEMNFYEIIRPYIMPTIIAFAVIMVYTGVKYREQGILKAIFVPTLITAMVEMLYFSIIAIVRIPISAYIMPVALAILVITLTLVMLNFEKK